MRMESLLQDFKYGIRMFARKPGFTMIAVIALALGIGANTAIFSIINAVLLRPLPYSDPSKLVMIWQTIPANRMGIDRLPPSVAQFIDWRERSKSFQTMTAITSVSMSLTGFGEPERVNGARVSANFFDLMGINPRIGRGFTASEDNPGSNRVIVISDGFWKRRFASAPNVIGKTLTFDNQSYTVIGIMPAGFQFPRSNDMPAFLKFPIQTDLWTPIAFTPDQIQANGDHYLAVMARLKTGTSLAAGNG